MATGRRVVKDLLLSEDVQGQVELLLNLLSATAGGLDVSRDVSEVIQVTIAGGVGHPTVKKLAFELCQSVSLSDSDYGLVLDGVRAGISSEVAELQTMALQYIPHLPPQHLMDLVDKGTVGKYLVPVTRAATPAVRSAATDALCSLLLVPEVQAQLAASPALGKACVEWWDAVVDGVGDSTADVILTSVACVNKLFAATDPTTSSSSSGRVVAGAGGGNGMGAGEGAGLQKAAGRAAQRLCVGLGPLLDTWRMLPSHAQVPAIQLQGHLSRHLLAHAESSSDEGFAGSGARLPESTTGSYAAALPAIINYLTNALNSLNAAVKLEAGKVLLRLAASASKLPALSRLRVCAAVPPSTSAAAIEALLELRDMLLVEAGLEEVVSLVASHLDSLQVSTRLKVLQRMWGLIALLQSPTDRMSALAAVWRTALDLHMAGAQARTQEDAPAAADGATLEAILSDTFLTDLIGVTPGGLPSSGPGSGVTSPRTSARGGGQAPGGLPATASSPARLGAPATPASPSGPFAGATGASMYGSAAAGPTGGSYFGSPAAAGPTGPPTPEPGGAPLVPGRPAPTPVVTPQVTGGAPAAPVSAAEAFGITGQGAVPASQLPTQGRGVLSSGSKKVLRSASRKVTSASRAAGDAIITATQGAQTALANTAGAVMSRLLDGGGPLRSHLPPTLKQELVVTLLEVLASHPSAELALQLPAGPPHDHSTPPPAAPAVPVNGRASATGAGAIPGLPTLAVTAPGSSAAAGAVPGVPGVAATPKSPPTTNKGGVTTLTEQQRDALASLFGGGPATPTAGSSSNTAEAAPSEPAAAPPAETNGNTPAITALPPILPAPVPLPPVLPPKVWTKEDLAAQPSVAELQARAVLWLGAAVTVLQRTKACLYWEPVVPPPMPGQPPSPALPPLQSVNLTTVPVDKWLQVLQCACHAARAVLRVHGHEELRSVYRAGGGRMLQQLSPWDSNSYLSKSLEGSAVQLQQVLQGELTRWRGLALAVRPRVLWVAAHYLELPGMLDETWAGLLAALEDVLLRLHRLEADALTRQLAMSARDGVLLKKFPLTQLQGPVGRVAGGKTPFDAAAASALVELPEYRSDALQVGLTVLQYLVWVVQAKVVRSPSGVAGQAEAALGRRLLDITKAVTAAEATGVDLKEWCRRMTRVLNAILDPAAAAAAAAGGAAGNAVLPPGIGAALAAVAAAPPKRANPTSSLTGGYNAAAGYAAFDLAGTRSSDESSSGSDSDGSGSESDGERESKSSSSSGSSSGGGADGDNSDSDAASIADSDDSDAAGGEAVAAPAAVLAAAAAAAAAAGRGVGGGSSPDGKGDSKKKKKKEKKPKGVDPNLLVGCPEASSGAWGYPFGGPRLHSMFISRRARRHRLLRWQLATAMSNARAAAAEDDPYGAAQAAALAAGGALDATGPVFSAASGFRLDKPSFWDSLPGGGYGWVELTGPNDPVVLSARYALSGIGGQELLLTLKAYNRLQMDLDGVEVVLRLVGPIRAERRDVTWPLPRLLPTEAATHTLKLIPSGYGLMQVHCRLLLPVAGRSSSGSSASRAPPALACAPLRISLARVLRPLESPPRGLEPFLHTWGSLPLQAEVSATCCWPEVDGQLLALSALARQPLTCVWTAAVPVVGGVQAAYITSLASSPKDLLAVLLVGQLLPEGDENDVLPAPGGDRDQEGEEDVDGGPPAAGGMSRSGSMVAGPSMARSPSMSVAPSSNGAAAAQPAAAAAAKEGPAPEGLFSGGAGGAWKQRQRGVMQLLVRSSSHEVMLVLKEHAAMWVRDLSGGTLSLGVAPPAAASWDKPLLHPALAQLEAAFRPAPLALPPPAAVPPPKLPPVPKFRRKLRDKADEEDSDAEDEEVPLTEEEKKREQKDLEAHAEECEKIKERTHQQLEKRSAAVLRHAALAEWRRLSRA